MDIVERARTIALGADSPWPLIIEAADEIERLREQAHYHYENGLKKDVEIERLREEIERLRGENLSNQYWSKAKASELNSSVLWNIESAMTEGE